MIIKERYIVLMILVTAWTVTSSVWAQNPLPAQAGRNMPDITILESQFSHAELLVGDTVKYFLKFDSSNGPFVYPVPHFAEQGFEVLEETHLEPQKFDGRLIQQYEYTLQARRQGKFQFAPVTLHVAGPWNDSYVSQPDPVQVVVSSLVDARIVTNSPLMLGETLNVSLEIGQRKPVTLNSIPQTLEATLQLTSMADTPTAENSVTPSPTLQPQVLQCTLDQSQTVTPQQGDGQTLERYSYVVEAQPTQAGEYVIPPCTITYRTAEGKEIQEQIEATSLYVLNANTPNLDIATDYRFLILPAVIGGAVLLGGVLVVLYLTYRHPRMRTALVQEALLPPGEVAHRELRHIQTMKLPAKGEFKHYYTLVSESVRKFLGAEFGFHVLERTTEEVMQSIQQRDVPPEIQAQTGQFLQQADLVKFAKYVPSLEETERAMQEAYRIVDASVAYHQPKVMEEGGSEKEESHGKNKM